MESPHERRHVEQQRRIIQILFIVVNVLLIEVRPPGWLWVTIGATFWVTVLILAAIGGNWMCGWICWLGAAQDIAEPIAKQRIRLNAAWGRGIVLAILVLWVPIAWWLVPAMSGNLQSPFGLNPSAWASRLFQIGLLLAVAGSVSVLGKRGLCRFLCPFMPAAAILRKFMPRRLAQRLVAAPPCIAGATPTHSTTFIAIDTITIASED